MANAKDGIYLGEVERAREVSQREFIENRSDHEDFEDPTAIAERRKLEEKLSDYNETEGVTKYQDGIVNTRDNTHEHNDPTDPNNPNDPKTPFNHGEAGDKGNLDLNLNLGN